MGLEMVVETGARRWAPDDAGPPGDADLAPEDVEELLELVEEAE